MSLSKNQQIFLNAGMSGENIFLTGKAGTGKSFIVKEMISQLRKKGKNVVALAPTGIAANNVGGQTIHSMFALNPFEVLDFNACNWLKSEKRRMLDKIDVMVIDEVSMLRPDVLDGIGYTLKKNKCKSIKEIQIILVGDLKQLESPMDDNFKSVLKQTYQGFFFHDSHIFKHLNFKTIELDEILRQSDEEFIHNLNIIREGGKSEYFKRFVSKKPKGIVLAPRNSTVSMYNQEGLRKLSTKEICFEAIITGNAKASDFSLESKVYVKDGAKVMYLINSKNNNLFNGTIGTFKVVDKSYFFVVNGVEYALEREVITKKEYVLNDNQDKIEMKEIGSISQYPIKLAYALTIHKSQGLTFDEVTVDLTQPCFAKGQMYTALSRVTSPNGLTIIT